MQHYGDLGSRHPLRKKIDFSDSGDNTIITGAEGLYIRVYQIFLVVNGLTDITFKSGSTGLTGAITASSFILDYSGKPWFDCEKGESFIINTADNKQVSGRVYYTQI